MYQYISPQRAKLCRINSFVPGNGGKLNSDLLDWKKSSVLKRRKSAVLGSAGLIGLPATPNSHAATAVSTVAALLAVAAAAAEGDNAKALLSLILLLLLRRRSRPGSAPPDRPTATARGDSQSGVTSVGVSLSPSKIFMEMNPIGHKFSLGVPRR